MLALERILALIYKFKDAGLKNWTETMIEWKLKIFESKLKKDLFSV